MDDVAFTPGFTTWHITWGTYGTRLHFGPAATVRVDQNQVGDPFITFDLPRYERMQDRLKHPPVFLGDEQRVLIESTIPDLCERGGWRWRVGAAKPDHVHVLLDVVPSVHGEKVRRLLKRWLTQALNEVWPPGSGRPGSLPEADARWWAEQGSNRAVGELDYLRKVTPYVHRQRITRP
jgi:REP element-mobilizing transposase RayT